MARPIVSVGVPVHNGLPHIETTLRACLDDVDGLEVVVSDNASTDGTSELVRELAAEDPRLRHEPTDRLVPVLDNFRRCVALTSGEFFRWNGADDWPGPGLHAAALAALRSRPDAVGVLADVQFVDGDGGLGLLHRESLAGADGTSPLGRLHAVVWGLRSSSTLAFTLMRRSALDRTGLLRDIPEASKVLAAELALAGALVDVPDVVLYRTFADEHRDRDHWVWLDPRRNAERRPLATPRQVRHHLAAVRRADLSLPQRVAGWADVLAALTVRRTAGKVGALRRRVTGARWEAPV